MNFGQMFWVVFITLFGFTGLIAYAQDSLGVQTSLPEQLNALLPDSERAGIAVGLLEQKELSLS